MFHSLLNEGLRRMSLHLSLPAKAYLGELLAFYIPSERLFEIDAESGRRTLKTLSEFYFKSKSASYKEKISLLKEIGDRSLYLGGFFRESLNRKLINLNYYVNMGQSAYENLAEYHPHEEVFGELSYYFLELLDVLSYIAQNKTLKNNESLVAVCDKYMKTGSKALNYQLEDHGLTLSRKTKHH